MAFLLFIGSRRLRMRRATLFTDGIKPPRRWRGDWHHRARYRYEVTFERGTAIGFGGHRSFLLAVAIAIWKTYANALYQRRLNRQDKSKAPLTTQHRVATSRRLVDPKS